MFYSLQSACTYPWCYINNDRTYYLTSLPHTSGSPAVLLAGLSLPLLHAKQLPGTECLGPEKLVQAPGLKSSVGSDVTEGLGQDSRGDEPPPPQLVAIPEGNRQREGEEAAA